MLYMIEIKAEDIEIGTFLTKNDGLPTMGLMIQTIEPVDLKQRILSNQKIVEKLEAKRDEIYNNFPHDSYEDKIEHVNSDYIILQSILQAGENLLHEKDKKQ